MKIKYLQVLVMPNDEILCLGKTIGFVKELGKFLDRQNTEFKQSIETEIAVNQEMQIIPESGQAWTQEFKEGYIDGLKRSLELLNPKN